MERTWDASEVFLKKGRVQALLLKRREFMNVLLSLISPQTLALQWKGPCYKSRYTITLLLTAFMAEKSQEADVYINVLIKHPR